MNDLVERYIHQVGRYLPPQERTEVEAELRSLIQDQLDDRFGAAPSSADISAVLTELGDPRHMAASYGSQQYLVGPDLYPTMMQVLRFGWLRIPALVVILDVVAALASDERGTVFGLFFETMWAAASATALFSGVVVLVFALMQRQGVELSRPQPVFNPRDLPAIDDPAAIDRFGLAIMMAFAAFWVLVMAYFLHVGGLTLRFNLNDPGEVIAAPKEWMATLIVVALIQLGLHLVALRRQRWSIGLWLGQMVFELVGVVAMYHVVIRPLYEHIIANDASRDAGDYGWIPISIAVVSFILTLMNEGTQLGKMVVYRPPAPDPDQP